jgi:hypothetical protein
MPMTTPTLPTLSNHVDPLLEGGALTGASDLTSRSCDREGVELALTVVAGFRFNFLGVDEDAGAVAVLPFSVKRLGTCHMQG